MVGIVRLTACAAGTDEASAPHDDPPELASSLSEH
jgi:hypothetical protein